eukprot:3423205-Rhodomonas_salina.1
MGRGHVGQVHADAAGAYPRLLSALPGPSPSLSFSLPSPPFPSPTRPDATGGARAVWGVGCVL